MTTPDAPRILVVEDDPDLSDLMALFLEGDGSVTLVRDAYQGLAAAQDRRPDLILIDLLMPGATGVDLLERLSARGVHAPVVVVTGLDRGALVDRALALGAREIVTKPFTISELRSAVHRALVPRPATATR